MVFILFLISPLLALMLSFKNIKSKEFMYSLLLMAALMGLVLNVNSGADLSYNLSMPKLWKSRDWSLILNERDYLFPIISKLFSYITINENCFGAFIFVIFASLYYQPFKIVTEHVLNQRTLWYYLSTFAVFLIFPYSMFFSMRFSLASLLFLWCILEIVIKDNKRFYWVLFLIPLLHYSFLLLIFIPIIHTFLKKKLSLCVIVFILSFSFNNPRVASYFDTFATAFLPERTASAVGQYASEEGLEYMNNRDAAGMSTINAKAYFFYYIQDVKTNIIMFSMLLILLVSYKNIKNDEMLLRLFTMMLLLFAGANIASSASRGDRFYVIACTYSIFLLYRIVHSNDNSNDYGIIVYKNKSIIIVTFIVAIIYGVLYNYAMKSDYDYFLMCFGNPLLAVLKIAGVLNI